MLKLNLNDDLIQEAIQSIAGKGKQSLTWEQFNAHLAKKFEKKNWLDSIASFIYIYLFLGWIDGLRGWCMWGVYTGNEDGKTFFF